MNLLPVLNHYRKFSGSCPEGVNWKNSEEQDRRLKTLSLLVNGESYSLNDWGCGYGRALKFFSPKTYHGYDINPEWGFVEGFIESSLPTRVADYTIASGLFNVKTEIAFARWKTYVEECISEMNRKSLKGFAFNCLSDTAFPKREDLFYLPPWETAQTCKPYGRVSLLQNYSPYDFTILVNK